MDDPLLLESHLYAPGKILGFVQETTGDIVQAIVSCCNYKHKQTSCFTTEWTQQYVYQNNGRRKEIMLQEY